MHAEESSNQKQKKPIEEEDAVAAAIKGASVSAVDTEIIESLTAEVDELKVMQIYIYTHHNGSTQDVRVETY